MGLDNRGLPAICFVGLENLPVLAKEYGHHGIGGAQLQQTLLAKTLVRRSYRVSMVVGDYGQADGAEWDGIKTYKAFNWNTGIPVLRFIHPRWTGLWSALKRADADIYYVSCAGAHVGQVALFARTHGRKLLFRVASDTDCNPAEFLIRFWRDKKLYVYGLNRAHAILAQTPKQQAALLDNFGRSSSVVASMSEPGDSRRPFAERDIDVLWVSNIRQLKRPDLALELAKRLPHLTFHLIGGPLADSQELFETVRKQAAALPNVHFHGLVLYHEIAAYYQRAKILLNTSDIEGFPNTYLQAWACGAPVIGFHDPNGIIARERLGSAVGTLEEMQDAVATLAKDAPLWTAASARSREFMAQKYSEEVMLAPYLATFAALSSRSQGR